MKALQNKGIKMNGFKRYRDEDDFELNEGSKYDRYLKDSSTFIALEKDKIKVSKILPAGIYSPFVRVTLGGATVGFDRVKLNNDTIIDLPDPTVTKILKLVQDFWSNEASDKYQLYGITRKLGILLWGSAGTGKTIASVRVVDLVRNLGGIILFNPEVNNLQSYLKVIRQIEPDKKIMVVWEEFDSINDSPELLSIMDGELQLSDVLFFATTNYINKIPARLKNRRSRFAHVLEMKNPNEECRKAYFESIIKTEEDKEKYLAPFVEATEGMSIDSCKNLVLDVLVYGLKIEDSIREMKKLDEEHSIGEDDFYESARKQAFVVEKDNKSPLRGI